MGPDKMKQQIEALQIRAEKAEAEVERLKICKHCFLGFGESEEICLLQKKLEALQIENARLKKCETIVKVFAKCMYYGEWKYESPNERVIEFIMREIGYWPFESEDVMITSTWIVEDLYSKAREFFKGNEK